MTNLYASIAEFKATNDTFGSDTKFDSTIQMALDAAAQAIDGYCNWGVSLIADVSPTTRIYTGSGDWFQGIDPCVTVTLVEVKGSPTDTAYTAWAANDWVAFAGSARFPNFNKLPFSGVMVSGVGNFRLFTSGLFSGQIGFPEFRRETGIGRGVPTVRITGRFGMADTLNPAAKIATISQAFRWVKRGQNAWADTVGDANTGILMFRKELDPDIKGMLENGVGVKPSLGKR